MQTWTEHPIQSIVKGSAVQRLVGEHTMLKHLEDTTFQIDGAGTNPIFVQRWYGLKRYNTDNALLIVHGFGEHSGRYRHIPEYLGRHFDVFYAMDLRGHGRSFGPRGHADGFDLFTEDLARVVREIRAFEQKKRLIILAHSFGALVVLRGLLSYFSVGKALKIDGVILSAPCLKTTVAISPVKKLFGRALNLALSNLQISSSVNPRELSHDPRVVQQYLDDRLVHHKITPKLYFEMEKTMEWIRSHPDPTLKTPGLFLLPLQDKIVDPQATVDFYKKLKSKNKLLVDYPDFYHESLNESGKEKVFEDIGRWMEKNFQGRHLSPVEQAPSSPAKHP